MPEIIEKAAKRRRPRLKPSDMVKVDADHLREEILKRYTLADMAFMIDRQANYFSPSGALSRTGMDINNLEKVCRILGKEVSEFLRAEESKPEPEAEKKPEPTKATAALDGECLKAITSLMSKMYEGIEMNGAAIGKVLEAIQANTDAVRELTEELRKVSTVTTDWKNKWQNHKKYGRF